MIEWFNGIKVTKYLPCLVCDRLDHQTKHIFTMDECLQTLEQSQDSLVCPFHDERVTIRDIAPDICLNDVHHDLVFERDHLHYGSVIKEGSFGKVCLVCSQTH